MRLTVAEGLELRRFEPHDAASIFAAVERDRAHLRHWLPWVDGTRSVAEIQAFLTRTQAQFDEGFGPNFGIWLDGELIGSLGCHPFDHANRACSLGYWVASGYQGRGIVTRCCRTLLAYLFDEVKLHRVEIRCGAGNARSRAIAQRLGFRLEGLLREAEFVSGRWVDLEVWSLLEDEFAK